MNEREMKEFKEHLQKRIQEVRTSKKAAREVLDRLGMLTPTGKLKKAFRPKPSPRVSR